MKTAQDIILKPIITEESMTGIVMKKYTFKVAKDANKIEIAKAIEIVFPGTKVPGYTQRLHTFMEKGNRYAYRRFKGNRILQ